MAYGFTDDFMEAFEDVLDEMENLGVGGNACEGAYAVLKHIADGEGEASTVLEVFDKPGANQASSYVDGVVGILVCPSLREKYTDEVQHDMLMRSLEHPAAVTPIVLVFGSTLPEEAMVKAREVLTDWSTIDYLINRRGITRSRQEW